MASVRITFESHSWESSLLVSVLQANKIILGGRALVHMLNSRSTHVAASGILAFFFMAE